MAFASGCASFSMQADQTKSLLRQGQFNQALAELEVLAAKDGKDQLMYMLDYAMALQITGNYKKSSEAFIKADQLLDQKDYQSLSQIVGASLGAEEMIQYKGESYEKFLINSMNALNFLMLKDYDSALVECRRINQKISSFKVNQRKPYEFSPFASYLSAMIWESQKKYDDAYIEYEAAYKLDPTIPGIEEDLIRAAYLASREQAFDRWVQVYDSKLKSEKPASEDIKSKFNLKAELSKKKKWGEVIVIFQQGFGARKVPRTDEPRFPTLASENLKTALAEIQITPDNLSQPQKIKTKVVYDIDQMAIRTLNDDYSSLVARRLGGLAAKVVVSDQIRQKNELLGDIAWIAMNIADRADLRQWSTLPARIQMARIFVPPGKYAISIQGLDSFNAPTADLMPEQTLQVVPGQKIFVNFRSLR